MPCHHHPVFLRNICGHGRCLRSLASHREQNPQCLTWRYFLSGHHSKFPPPATALTPSRRPPHKALAQPVTPKDSRLDHPRPYHRRNNASVETRQAGFLQEQGSRAHGAEALPVCLHPMRAEKGGGGGGEYTGGEGTGGEGRWEGRRTHDGDLRPLGGLTSVFLEGCEKAVCGISPRPSLRFGSEDKTN